MFFACDYARIVSPVPCYRSERPALPSVRVLRCLAGVDVFTK